MSLWSYLIESQKLLWTIRLLRLRLAFLRMRLWLKEATLSTAVGFQAIVAE